MSHLKKGALLALLFCLSACTPLQTKQLQQQAITPPAVLLDVPFVPQDPYYCGPASVSMLLQHRGQPASQGDIAKDIYLPGRKGTLQTELVAYLRHRGLLVYQVEPQLRAVLTEVAAGNPVLVLKNLSLPIWPRWHYAVVVGYDSEQGQVILHSADRQNYRLALGTFERTWARSGHWGIVAGNPAAGELPASLPADSHADRLLEAMFELEASSQRLNKVNSYAHIAQRWPNSHRAWFGLGNALYESDHSAAGRLSALKAFMRAEALQADVGYYNNIAYVAAELGCQDLYQASLSCGLALDPGNRYLTDTQKHPPSAISHDIDCPVLTCNAPD